MPAIAVCQANHEWNEIRGPILQDLGAHDSATRASITGSIINLGVITGMCFQLYILFSGGCCARGAPPLPGIPSTIC